MSEPNQNSQNSLNGESARHSEAVVRLYSQHQRWLHGYLTALLGDASDAEDVMQEVSVVMWQKHEQFELGTNFVSWLSVIAYHQVQKFWRERKKSRRFQSTELLDQLAACMVEDFELQEARRAALGDCVSHLRANDRELVRECYGSHTVTAKSVAEKLGRPVGTVYKALTRIRTALMRCINNKVATEGIA